MDKEEIAVRIEELIREYRNKKNEYEKILKNKNVKRYFELSESISRLKNELYDTIEEVAKLQEKYKNI